jgi:hypothetical protein
MSRTAAVRRPVSRAPRRREIPLDDEPLTPEDMRAIEEGDAAFARGDYCTLDELKADLARDVARLRTHKGPKGPSAPSRS